MHHYPRVAPNPREKAALAELRRMIEERYPTSTFRIVRGDDPTGWYLEAVVDVDDTYEVWTVVVDRMIDYQVEDDLDVYVSLEPTPERAAAQWREYFAERAAREALPTGT